MIDSFRYFTTWSLLVSYSIFIWALFLGIPKWLFLFAACCLTTTSILGTFFLTIPTAQEDASKRGITIQKVMLEDSLIHSGPLIVFLLFFNLLSKRTIDTKPIPLFNMPKIFTGKGSGKGSDVKFSLQNYHKILMTVLIVIFGYLIYINFEKVYFYDYFTLVILCACVFVTSFQVYFDILSKKF